MDSYLVVSEYPYYCNILGWILPAIHIVKHLALTSKLVALLLWTLIHLVYHWLGSLGTPTSPLRTSIFLMGLPRWWNWRWSRGPENGAKGGAWFIVVYVGEARDSCCKAFVVSRRFFLHQWAGSMHVKKRLHWKLEPNILSPKCDI